MTEGDRTAPGATAFGLPAAPLVSIALATFNGEPHLPAQLESLLQQTHPRLELVAGDDASTDGTWDLLQQFRPRFLAHGIDVRLHRRVRNLGLRVNIEAVLRDCRGDWIAPCDQDDIWRPDKIQRLLAAAGDAVLVYADSELIDEHGRSLQSRVSDRITLVEGRDPRLFALANCVSGHAMLFRRSLLDDALPLPGVGFHDWWLAFVAANVGRVRYLDEPLVQFRQHRGNASRFTGRQGAAKPSTAAKHRAQQRDLDALAAFAGPQQAFFIELAEHWRQRLGQALTPRLAALLWRHRRLVFATKKRAPGGGRHALKYLAGGALRR